MPLIAALTSALLVGGLALCVGWFGGRDSPLSPDSNIAVFESTVVGRSMVPTLFPAGGQFGCEHCGISIRLAEVSLGSDFAKRPPRCFHCGKRELRRQRDVSADRVRWRALGPQTQLNRGDLVVVDRTTPSVKRIFALAGDTIGRRESGELAIQTTNPLGDRRASRILKDLPRIPIDVWPSGRTSRWQHREGWWIYRHTSVHDFGRPAAILDDFPWNVDVQRQLKPAFAWHLTLRWDTSVHAEIEILARQNVNRRGMVPISAAELGVRIDELPESNADPPITLSESSPLAFRVRRPASARTNTKSTVESTSRIAAPSQIRLERELRNTAGPSDFGRKIPYVVPPGHVFVCGDNDPISVDSRHWGAIRRGDLLGRVIEISVAP